METRFSSRFSICLETLSVYFAAKRTLVFASFAHVQSAGNGLRVIRVMHIVSARIQDSMGSKSGKTLVPKPTFTALHRLPVIFEVGICWTG